MVQEENGSQHSVSQLTEALADEKVRIHKGNEESDIQIKDTKEKLEARYKAYFEKWHVPILNDEKEFDVEERRRCDFMVELCLVDGVEEDKKWKQCNEMVDYHIKRREEQARSDPLEDLIIEKGERIFLRGVAGAGKTSFSEHIALSWAKREIHEQYELVFFIKCRDLIRYNGQTATEILKEVFPDTDIDNLKKNQVGGTVLFVIDGLDEVPDIESIFKAEQQNGMYLLLHDILSKESRMFPGHSTLVTGRPHIHTVLKDNKKTTGKMRTVEITGFSANSVKKFVENFARGDERIKSSITNMINDNAQLKALSVIPQFLTTICCVNVWGVTEQVRSLTELYVWVLVAFLKQHLHLKGEAFEILKDKNVSQFIKIVSQISYHLMKENKLVFKKDEIPHLNTIDDKDLKRIIDAFLVEVKTWEGDYLQFKHLTLQEVLAAIYCFESNISIDELLHNEMYVIVQFVAGFVRAKECLESDNIVSMFIKEVLTHQKPNELQEMDNHLTVEIFAERLMSRYRNKPFYTSTLLNTFSNLIIGNDSFPRAVEFHEKTIFGLYRLNRRELAGFCHLMKSLLRSHGVQVLHNMTVNISWTNLTSHLDFVKDVFPLLLRMDSVRFCQCSLPDDFVSFLQPQQQSPDCVQLKSLTLLLCEVKEHALVQLSPLIPQIESVSLANLRKIGSTIKMIVKEINGCDESKRRLAHFSLESCDLEEEDIMHLSQLIPVINSVELSYLKITGSSMAVIAKGINTCDLSKYRLTKLSLAYCFLEKEHIMQLSPAIPRIKSVDLSGNNISAPSIKAIVKEINTCDLSRRNLAELFLVNCKLDEEGLFHFFTVISSLEKVDLSNNDVNLAAINRLVECIQHSYNDGGTALQLKELILKKCRMDCECYHKLKVIFPLIFVNFANNLFVVSTFDVPAVYFHTSKMTNGSTERFPAL